MQMASKNVIEVTDQNFETEVAQSALPVLVDFSATWCGPCKMLSPIVDKLADETVGKYKICKIDIDDSPAITSRFGVRGVPTVLVFKGGAVKGQHVGLTNKERLVQLLEA